MKANCFVAAQIAACRALAKEGSCVLVDRHSGAALEGSSNHVRIFIHADFADRAARIAMEKGITTAAAEKELKRRDRSYRSYYRGSNRGWGEADSYDLTLNTSDADVKALCGHALEFLRVMSCEKAETETARKVG